MQKMDETRTAAASAEVKTAASANNELIVGKVPQGYETNINVRIVPGRGFDLSALLGCRPRKGAPRRDAEPLALPPDLLGKLKLADKAVVAWLAKDAANARLFMERPAEALALAGVDLDRGEMKTIERVHSEVREAAVVAPGVKVAALNVAVFQRGQVGKIKPGTSSQNKRDSDAGCAKGD
jgi:hypothetical protein